MSGDTKRVVLNDFIILGRAAPDRIRNGRSTVCIAGYSPTHGFIRIYPTRIDFPLKRWDIVKVPVERNVQDTRRESWKIRGSKGEWDSLSEKIECVEKVQRKDWKQTIANLTDICVEDINNARRSLGIVKPKKIRECYFSERDDYKPGVQLTLFGKQILKTKKDYRYVPKIKYTCPDCKTQQSFHNQQLLEFGVYEWMRKHPLDQWDQVWDNLLLYSDKHDIYFFVGNQATRRTSFMIISILRVPKGPTSKPLITPKK